MKKNIFKKIVATLATAAMAVGMFTAMPADNAKAAATTKMVAVLSDATDVKAVLLDIHNYDGGKFLTPSGKVTTESAVSGWGRNLYEFTKDSAKANVWSINVEGEVNLDAGDWTNMQLVVVKNDGSVCGFKYWMANDPADNDNQLTNAKQWNANSALYYSLDLTKTDWPNVTASTTDPTKVDASGVIAAINAIGKVELTDASLTKITTAEQTYKDFLNNGGDKADVTNYATLTDARAKYDQLVAAEEAKAAGKLTIFVKTPENWDEVAVYGWYKDGAKAFGEWPGTKLTALEKNTGWYSCSFDIKKAANIIFNNNNKGEQTVDWNGVVAGTYYMELSEKADDGKFKVDNVSTKAPAGWKDENAQDVDTQPDSTPDKTPNPETGDASAVVLMLAVAVVAAGAVVVSRKRAVNE